MSVAALTSPLLMNQDHLAKGLVVLEEPVALRDLDPRQLAIDDRAQGRRVTRESAEEMIGEDPYQMSLLFGGSASQDGPTQVEPSRQQSRQVQLRAGATHQPHENQRSGLA